MYVFRSCVRVWTLTEDSSKEKSATGNSKLKAESANRILPPTVFKKLPMILKTPAFSRSLLLMDSARSLLIYVICSKHNL